MSVRKVRMLTVGEGRAAVGRQRAEPRTPAGLRPHVVARDELTVWSRATWRPDEHLLRAAEVDLRDVRVGRRGGGALGGLWKVTSWRRP